VPKIIKVEAKRGQQVMVLISQSHIRHCPLAMAAPSYGGGMNRQPCYIVTD